MKFNNSFLISKTNSIISDYTSYNSIEKYVSNSDLPSITSFFHKFCKTTSFSSPTGIMPPGVLYIGENYVIYERPPQYQNIELIFDQVDNINYETSKSKLYRIPLPWQLYIATYSTFDGRIYPNSVRMYFMKSSLHMIDPTKDHLYLPPLPNFFANALLCRPMYYDAEDVNRYTNDVSGVIHATYDWIWNSGTNLDLTMAPLELIRQANINPDQKYIIPSSFSSSEVHLHSYYISSQSVNLIMQAWESVDSLVSACEYIWPSPSSVDRPFYALQNSSDYLDEYLHINGLDDYHNCDPDYDDCNCSPEYDSDDFAHFALQRILQPKTFLEIMYSIMSQDLSELSRNSFVANPLSKSIFESAVSLAN
jgi:hypothetical protein